MPFNNRSKKKEHNKVYGFNSLLSCRKQDERKAVRRMVVRIAKLQELNTDPKIAEFLETARVDLANVVNLMYQNYRKVREAPKRIRAKQLYETTKLTIPEIAIKTGLCARTVSKVAKEADLSRYRKKEKE